MPAEERAARTVGSVMARDDGSSALRVALEEPLETLLGQEGLTRLGAIMAVDGEGVLRGIVTVDAVRRALQGSGAGLSRAAQLALPCRRAVRTTCS